MGATLSSTKPATVARYNLLVHHTVSGCYKMVDNERLDNFLSSDDSPDDCMQISDLDGFLTGVLCSPELILPDEWFPIVWRDPEPIFTDEGVWAIQEILNFYNEIATGLNANPPYVDPMFWERDDGTIVAMDWCEGFMDAYVLREKAWDTLLATERGQDWLFPIFVHLLDNDGNSLAGISDDRLHEVLDEAAQLISVSVPGIFAFWQSKRLELH